MRACVCLRMYMCAPIIITLTSHDYDPSPLAFSFLHLLFVDSILVTFETFLGVVLVSFHGHLDTSDGFVTNGFAPILVRCRT